MYELSSSLELEGLKLQQASPSMVEEIRLCGIGAAGASGFMCWGLRV